VGKPPEKLKSYHDDQAEHSRGGGYRAWCEHAEEWRTLHAQGAQKIYIHGTEKRRVVVALLGVVVVPVEENSGV
jgi:hypothetical protein